jgi:hypothetical protein
MTIAFEYEDEEGTVAVEKIPGLTSEQTQEVFVELIRAANEKRPSREIGEIKERLIRAFRQINKFPKMPNTFYAPSLESVYRRIGLDAKLSPKECADAMLALTSRGMVKLTEMQLGIVQVKLIDPERFISPEARSLMRQLGIKDALRIVTAPADQS